MNRQPFISFIIPTRNEAKMIERCLGAIDKLDYDAGLYEKIVVDNGSVDDTTAMAERSGARVIKMFNVTISELRNRGAQNARGDFLAFIDADCVLEKDWLKNALQHFPQSIVACVGSYTNIPADSSWMEKAWTLQKRSRTVEEVDWLPSRSFLVRTEAFKDICGFNESLITCEDVDFCYRLRKANYKIISDNRLMSVHLGEAKTLSDFFRKERWRGQSNLRGLASHGFYWQEIPSVVLPVLYFIVLFILPISIIQRFLWGVNAPLFINLGLIVIPPLLLALRRSLRAGDFSFLGKLTFLYLVSLLARTSTILPLTQDDGHRDVISETKLIKKTLQ